MPELDVVIIGAGHNGLTCAAYLGMAGLSVRVVERRDVIGGTAVTEEFHPGFRNSVAAYTVSLLQPKVIAGPGPAPARAAHRRAPRAEFPAAPDGRYLLSGEGRTESEIAKFSAKDASATSRSAALSEVADLLRELVLQAPPNVTWRDVICSLPEAMKFAPIGGRVMRFDRNAQRALFDLYRKSAGDYLDQWFETDAVKALFGFDSIVGNLASPYTRGSAYVLLHHWFGEVNGKKGVWGHAIGGMGAISEAMANAAGAARRAHRHRRGGQGGHCRARPRRRRRARRRHADQGARRGGERQSEIPVRDNWCRAMRAGLRRRADAALEGRLRHVPHERRARRAAGLRRPARRRRSSHLRHHPGAEP